PQGRRRRRPVGRDTPTLERMRANLWSLIAACILVSSALGSLNAGAMRGSGSPDWDVGNPRSLTDYTCPAPGLPILAQMPCSPSPAVFYPAAAGPAFVPTCAVSPGCIPTVPLNQASPWFG